MYNLPSSSYPNLPLFTASLLYFEACIGGFFFHIEKNIFDTDILAMVQFEKNPSGLPVQPPI